MDCSPPLDHSVALALQVVSLGEMRGVTEAERWGPPLESGLQLLGGREEEERRSARVTGSVSASRWRPAVGSRETGGICGGERGDRSLRAQGCSMELVAAALQS